MSSWLSMIECTSFQSMLLVSQIWLDMEPLQKEHQTQRFSSAITQLICVPNGKQFGRYVVVNSDELRKKCVHSRGNPFSNLRSGYISTKKAKPQFRKKKWNNSKSYWLDFFLDQDLYLPAIDDKKAICYSKAFTKSSLYQISSVL